MIIFLDSHPLGLLAIPPSTNTTQEVLDIKQWLSDCVMASHTIIIPESIDYEIRRELLRSNKTTSVAELDLLKSYFTYLPLTTDAILQAAELWAQTRQAGKPTSHDENIDIDVILAAQVITSGYFVGDTIVATSNLRHLSLFVPANAWRNIQP
jgi:predicted nucleic acid-binding protein